MEINLEDAIETINSLSYLNYCHNRKRWDIQGRLYNQDLWAIIYGDKVIDYEKLYQLEKKEA